VDVRFTSTNQRTKPKIECSSLLASNVSKIRLEYDKECQTLISAHEFSKWALLEYFLIFNTEYKLATVYIPMSLPVDEEDKVVLLELLKNGISNSLINKSAITIL